ncbi:MAG: OPT/YSL family transporter [Eubacteriales bacterium]|nr:OPT/YSL family transporter [Eubacteriales bacterium]MDD4541833.1 OPT/YSL family transporter [Eubacteriales bacterium]
MDSNKQSSLFPNFTVRALILAIFGSILMTASSMYVALRMSALPWPTVFVAVLSLTLMRLFRSKNLREVNIASTGMSAGAMVAGGLAFTIPGLFMSGVWTIPEEGSDRTLLGDYGWTIFLVALIGVVLGTLLCALYRKRAIEQLKLPYPIGQASAETLKAGHEGGSKARVLFTALIIAAIFVLLRDQFALFPGIVLFSLAGINIAFQFSPMAIGIGSLIGFKSTALWLGGAAIGAVVINRIGVSLDWFASTAEAASFIQMAAIGLMVGSGLATLLVSLISSWRSRKLQDQSAVEQEAEEKTDLRQIQKKSRLPLGLLAVAVAFVLSIVLGLSVPVSLLLLVGVFLASAMSTIITGETGLNPMEIFGILVLLAIRLLVPLTDANAFLVAAIVAVACGFAGDMMNDFKTGSMLGTAPASQLLIEFIGGFFGAITATLAFVALTTSYGGFGPEFGLPAAQAQSVTAMIAGIGNPLVFIVAALIGIVLVLFKIPATIIGIGLLLTGAGLALPIFLGGVLELIIRKKYSGKESQMQLVSAGLLGGEGITGTILAIVAMFTG